MSCFVKNCGNYQYKKSIENMRFFRFPSDKSLFKKWVKVCGIEVNERQDNMRVCQKHFADEDYRLQDILLNTNILKRRLRPGAVPSQYLPTQIKNSEQAEQCNNKIQTETVEKPIETNSFEIKTCCVKSCYNTNKCGKKITFFRFPADITRRKKWIKFFKLKKNVVKEGEVCSGHFEEKYLIEKEEQFTLTKSAIPTIRDTSSPIIKGTKGNNKLSKSKKKLKPTTVTLNKISESNSDKDDQSSPTNHTMPIFSYSDSSENDDENISLSLLRKKIQPPSKKITRSATRKVISKSNSTANNKSSPTEHTMLPIFVSCSDPDENEVKIINCPITSDIETEPPVKEIKTNKITYENEVEIINCPITSDIETELPVKKIKTNKITLKQSLESSSDTDDCSTLSKNLRRKDKLKTLKTAFMKIAESNKIYLQLARKRNKKIRRKNKKISKLKNKISKLKGNIKEIKVNSCPWCLSPQPKK